MKSTMIDESGAFKGLKVLVTGVGRYKLGSNNSAARFFATRGAEVTITDPKPSSELKEGLKHLKGLKASYHLGGYRRRDFLAADLVVKNQGTRSVEPFLDLALERGAAVSTDVGFFMEFCPPVPTVGVTGTRGKSTTTALIGEMISADGCSARVGGNMKVSPLNFLDKVRADYRDGKCATVVLELSSWMLEGWAKQGIAPQIAVVTNVYPDHLSTYGSFAAYAAAKAEILACQDEDGVAILNRDNAVARKMSRSAHGKVFWFSKKRFSGDGAYAEKGKIFFLRSGKREAVADLSDIRHLKGEHNLENALAAVCAAKALGLKDTSVVKALRSFRGLPDRQELVREVRGVRFVNDTTATSPDGAIAALRTFATRKRKVILIAGGKDKELDFKEMAKEVKARAKDLILLSGTGSEKLVKELKRIGYPYETVPVVNDMPTAVRLARAQAEKGDIVLLSPGCASFGLFQNEFDRGEKFVKAVKAL